MRIDIETSRGLEETVGIHRARYLIIRRLIIPVIDRYPLTLVTFAAVVNRITRATRAPRNAKETFFAAEAFFFRPWNEASGRV